MNDTTPSAIDGAPPEAVAVAAFTLLLDVYDIRGALIWLQSSNRALGNANAIDLIERGEGRRVIDVIDALRSGAFT